MDTTNVVDNSRHVAGANGKPTKRHRAKVKPDDRDMSCDDRSDAGRYQSVNAEQFLNSECDLTPRQFAELLRGHPTKRDFFVLSSETHVAIAKRFRELRQRQADEFRELLRDCPPDDIWIDLKEAARIAGCGVDKVRQYIQFHRLPCIRRDAVAKKSGPGLPTGKTSPIRIRKRDLLRFLEQRTEVLT